MLIHLTSLQTHDQFCMLVNAFPLLNIKYASPYTANFSPGVLLRRTIMIPVRSDLNACKWTQSLIYCAETCFCTLAI